jgi:hypothetical protein
MGRFLAVVMISSLAIAQSRFAGAQSEPNEGRQSASNAESVSGGPSALPPMPPGKSTVMGGEIHDVDPVRDQFTLKVFGGQAVKMLYDERTQVYRDGIRTPLRDLRSDDHASVETVLDGTNVFALSIHMLSQSPEGEAQGQVLSYNSGTGELAVSDALSRDPIKLLVPAGTPIVRQGQDAFSDANQGPSDLVSDLVRGTLISVEFKSNNEGRGVASHIAILATPGSAFVFSGNITFLDLHSGLLALVDPRDNKSYQISFDTARYPVSRDLHEGEHITVTANFDGARYVASAIAVN